MRIFIRHIDNCLSNIVILPINLLSNIIQINLICYFYTYKLEKYIRSRILPKILLIPNKYKFAGSFKRKVPYVTDIDVVSNVNPEINSGNIYDKVLKLIEKFKTEEYSDIIFIHVICGVDERFDLKTGSDGELNKIKVLLDENDRIEIDDIQRKYSHDNDKKILSYKIISKYYKLRWTRENIIKNEMTLAGGIIIKFTDVVKKNQLMTFQYFVNINAQPVGLILLLIMSQLIWDNYILTQLQNRLQVPISYKEYYFMMFPLKNYFGDINKQIYQEMSDIIKKNLDSTNN